MLHFSRCQRGVVLAIRDNSELTKSNGRRKRFRRHNVCDKREKFSAKFHVPLKRIDPFVKEQNAVMLREDHDRPRLALSAFLLRKLTKIMCILKT